MFATRTEQTTQTTGTGTLDLIAALTGRRNFSTTIGGGNPCYYIIQTSDEAQWEEGWGTVTAGSPDQLTRTTVVNSSNSGSLVNFPAGTKTVFIGDNADTIRFGHVGQVPIAGGSAAAITVAYSPAVRHLKAGMRFSFIASNAGAGTATTLAINTLSAGLKKIDGTSDPDVADIVAGDVVEVMHDGTNFRLLSVSTTAILKRAYPVGSLYFNYSDSTSPATLLGFGTWTAVALGKVLVGVGTHNDGVTEKTFAAGDTGGEFYHSLTEAENATHSHGITDPGHTHAVAKGGGATLGSGATIAITTGNSGSSTTGITINNSGSGTKHNNLQPYLAVYIWRRTA